MKFSQLKCQSLWMATSKFIHSCLKSMGISWRFKSDNPGSHIIITAR